MLPLTPLLKCRNELQTNSPLKVEEVQRAYNTSTMKEEMYNDEGEIGRVKTSPLAVVRAAEDVDEDREWEGEPW